MDRGHGGRVFGGRECLSCPASDIKASRNQAFASRQLEDHFLTTRPPHTADAYADRARGCLIGGAVGDAFGYAIEFDSLAAIRAAHGPAGLREPVLDGDRLLVSDDTQMTLFTAEGLVRAMQHGTPLQPSDALEHVRAETLAWFKTQGGETAEPLTSRLLAYRSLWRQRAPGNTCLTACRAGAVGMPEAPINDSKGCGGVMRVAPIGLIPALSGEAAFGLAARAAAQTHGHPSGYLPAGVLAATVRGLLDGSDITQAIARAARLAACWPDAGETIAAVEAARRRALDQSADHQRAIAEIGEGWVGEEALGIGLYAVLVAAEFADAIRIAANHDGDSDSTASIAGQLYGAWRGRDAIPDDWVGCLDVLEPLQDVAERLIAAFSAGNAGG